MKGNEHLPPAGLRHTTSYFGPSTDQLAGTIDEIPLLNIVTLFYTRKISDWSDRSEDEVI